MNTVKITDDRKAPPMSNLNIALTADNPVLRAFAGEYAAEPASWVISDWLYAVREQQADAIDFVELDEDADTELNLGVYQQITRALVGYTDEGTEAALSEAERLLAVIN